MEKLSNLPKAPKQLAVAKSEQDPAERACLGLSWPTGVPCWSPPSPGGVIDGQASMNSHAHFKCTLCGLQAFRGIS